MYTNDSTHLTQLIRNRKLSKTDVKQLAGLHVKFEMKRFKFRNHVHNFSFTIR